MGGEPGSGIQPRSGIGYSDHDVAYPVGYAEPVLGIEPQTRIAYGTSGNRYPLQVVLRRYR